MFKFVYIIECLLVVFEFFENKGFFIISFVIFKLKEKVKLCSLFILFVYLLNICLMFINMLSIMLSIKNLISEKNYNFCFYKG